VDLSAEESATLSELLGGSHLTRHIEHLGEGIVPGLSIDWVPYPDHRAPHTIGDLGVRTRTGASIVALVRDNTAIPAPGPEQELLPGDTVLIVGTQQGISAATTLLEDDEQTASS
jgi:TrkA domain protein